MKNTRYKVIQEASEAVNNVQLDDLLDNASQVEIKITQLVNMALKFSDQGVKKAALALKARAQDFTNMLTSVMMANNGLAATAGAEEAQPQLQQAQPAPDSKINLDKVDTNKDVISSSYTPSMNESVIIMKRFNFSTKDVKKLTESHVQALMEIIGSELGQYMSEESDDNTAEIDPVEKHDPITGPSKGVEVDLTEPYTAILDGLEGDRFATFKSGVVSALQNYIDTIQDGIGETASANFSNIINQISTAGSPEEYDMAMSSLYDFADNNDIVIKTIGA